MATTTRTAYRVTAYRPMSDGRKEDLCDPATLGSEIDRTHATRAEAETVAAELQRTVADVGLDPRTVYEVEEVEADEAIYFAAIDQGSDISGAVYGVGTSESAALRDARRLSSDGEYAVVPCTEAAYKYVKANGGAPSSDLSVSWRRAEGVCLRSEEE